MRKKSVKILCLALSLSFSLVFTTSVFAETSASKCNSKLINSNTFKVNEKMIEHLKELKEAQKAKNNDISIMGPAPKLTYLEVYAAISTNYPQYEYFKRDQYLSTQDHGGTELFLVTAELGYGYSQIAKINGNLLKSVSSQAIDVDGDKVIDGWYYWWDASGNQSGQFTYQNTSTNSPWNTMSDWINIK